MSFNSVPTKTLNATSMGRLRGVHPEMIRLLTEAIKDCPVQFQVVEGLRTKQRQIELYAQGRATPGPIVTWTLNSKHIKQVDGFGHAVDICPYKDGVFLWNDVVGFEKIFNHVNSVAKKLGIAVRSGADWDHNLVMDTKERDVYIKRNGTAPKPDAPHWELING